VDWAAHRDRGDQRANPVVWEQAEAREKAARAEEVAAAPEKVMATGQARDRASG
jgi:hypothetical protein